MSETELARKDIQEMRYRLEQIEGMLALSLRSQPGVLEDVVQIFKDNPLTTEIYLAIDGTRRQKDIVEYLNNTGVSISQSAVSKKISVLKEYGIIRELSYDNGITYQKTPLFEEKLKLSKRLLAGQASNGAKRT